MQASYFYIATTTFAIACFIILGLYKFYKNEKMPLAELISISLTASTIPTGILLVLCAYNTKLIQDFEGLGVFLAIAGLTFLYTIINRIKSGIIQNKTSSELDPNLNTQQRTIADEVIPPVGADSGGTNTETD